MGHIQSSSGSRTTSYFLTKIYRGIFHFPRLSYGAVVLCAYASQELNNFHSQIVSCCMGAKHGPQQSSSALALMHLTCGHYARFWGYHTPDMWQMWKSEQPPDAVLCPTWSLTDVCGSLDILPAAHHQSPQEDHAPPCCRCGDPGAASRLEATVRKTQPHLASCSEGRLWPTEHIGLASAWRKAAIRDDWRRIVDTATLQRSML